MNTPFSRPSGRLVAGALLLAFAPAAYSATVTWGGADGEYTTGANWTGGSVPNTGGGDTAVINGGVVTYTPGGDLAINNGGTLRISGGSWTQVGGIAWIQLSGGALLVDGGTFNQGTAGNIVRNATTSITVSSGAANFNGEFANAGSLVISGGSVSIQNNFVANTGTVSITGGTTTVGGELKPQGASFTMSGGVLNASLISFDATAASFNLSGGSINISGSFTSGIFANSPDAYLNFTAGSAGSLHLTSVSMTAAGDLLTGRVRANNAIDAAAFEIISDGGAGSIVRLVGSAIPEPSSFSALAGLAVLGMVATRRRRV